MSRFIRTSMRSPCLLASSSAPSCATSGASRACVRYNPRARRVEPSGISVEPHTKLAIGSIVLVSAQGRWWRAEVIGFEGPDHVRVRYPGWDAKWEEAVPRSELQVPPH